MDRSKNFLILLSIIALVLVTLLGSIVTATAGQEDIPAAQDGIAMVEEVVTAPEAPAAEAEIEDPLTQGEPETPSDGEAIETEVVSPEPDQLADGETASGDNEVDAEAPVQPEADTDCIIIKCNKSKICVIKFLDANENGVMDPGETGMAGVTILLNGENSKLTGADGEVCFSDLAAGDYTVSEVVPEGYHATTDTSVSIELDCDQTATVFFGNAPNPPPEEEPKGSISGHKWRDNDWDGEYDEGEEGLGGVTIELWKDGVKVRQTTTDTNGYYSFTDLEPGDYVVKEVVPEHMIASSPISIDLSLAQGQDIDGIDFFNYCGPGVVEVLVFEDQNCNGILDDADTLFPEPVLISLYHVLGGIEVPADGWDGSYQKLTGSGVYPPPWMTLPLPPYPYGCTGWNNLPTNDGRGYAEYIVKMTTPDGWIASAGTENGPFALKCEWTCRWKQVKFLLSPTFYITGHKWEDLNCNGEHDEGEPPVEGVTIELYKDGELYATTTTAADGSYIFEELPDGVYTVMEVLPDGWSAVSPAGGIYEGVEVGCGDNVENLDFLNTHNTSITGHKWEDLNCNGEHDEGEPPVEGVTIELYKDGELYATTTTAADGSYSFTNLPAGEYTVVEVLPDGWYAENPDDGSHEGVVVGPGQPIEGLDFINARYLSITGNKWEDLNCNGEHDEGEPPVEGVTIELYKDGELYATTTTAADGSYSFTGLLPGEYAVVEVLPDGWFPTNPEEGSYEGIELVCGQPIEGLDFLNSRYGSICGIKYLDINENGIMDEGEEGLDGITITLNEGEYTTVTTDGGKFCFENLIPGVYLVSVDESTAIGYYPTGPTSIEVDLSPGEQEEVYFGNAPYGSISGHKWFDSSADGIWDEDETTTIAGITINLYEGSPPVGDPIATTVTGEDGSYAFTDLKPGDYTVEEEGLEGYFACTPVSVGVVLEPGEGAVVDFGNCHYGRIEGLKFLDLDGDGSQDPDEPGLEGVEITLTGLGETVAMAITTSGEDGTFFFDDLKPGDYEVAETIPAGYYATRPIRIEVVVNPGESVMVIFANAPYGSIVGNKWLDTGDNLISPDTDLPGGGFTILLSGETLGGEPVSMETTTDDEGYYSFLILEAGNYTVEEVFDPEKYISISEEKVDVELAPGEEKIVDFLNAEFEVLPGPNPTPPEVKGDVLPKTGVDQLPVLIAAGLLMILGLAVLAAGLRRRYQE